MSRQRIALIKGENGAANEKTRDWAIPVQPGGKIIRGVLATKQTDPRKSRLDCKRSRRSPVIARFTLCGMPRSKLRILITQEKGTASRECAHGNQPKMKLA